MINFINKPKLSEHEIDRDFNDRRLALIPHIEEFLNKSELFAGKEVRVEFSHLGVSSQVCFIESGEDKYVLKIPLRVTAEGEALFLKKWEEAGVAVPHIFDSGTLGGHTYFLMSYVDAPMLSETIKSLTNIGEVRYEMGKILSRMHKPITTGIGQPINGNPEFSDLRRWISSEHIAEKIKTVQELGLLNDDHGPISDVINILVSYSEQNPNSSYCHFDYGAGNIMATEPLTIIDPNPMVSLGVLDFGRSLLYMISGGVPKDVEKRFREGYLEDSANLDDHVIQAAIVLNAYLKFPYWKAKERNEEIERVRGYLVENRRFLGPQTI